MQMNPFKIPTQDSHSISGTRTTSLFRAVKTCHLRCSNEGSCNRQVATADGSTPYRPAVVPVVRLQNVLLILVVRLYRRADITDWDGEGTFPAWTLGARIRPLAFSFERRFHPVVRCDVVVVASYFVSTYGRKNNVLHSDPSVVPATKIGSPWWGGNPTPLMRTHGDYVVFPSGFCVNEGWSSSAGAGVYKSI